MPVTKSRRTAYHEAGHALIAYLEGVETEKVSTVPGEDSFGAYEGIHRKASEVELDDGHEFTDETAAKHMRITAAGAEAERLVFGGGELEGRDFDTLADLAVRHPQIDQEEMMDQVLEMLRSNRKALDRLAESLLERGTLSGDEMEALLRKHC